MIEELNNKLYYNNKTAIETLIELCNIRKYPQPLFLDRTINNKIIVTTVVGGKIYGTSSEGDNITIACEEAAKITLLLWLGDKFNVSLLKSSKDINKESNNNNERNNISPTNNNNNNNNIDNNNNNNNNNTLENNDMIISNNNDNNDNSNNNNENIKNNNNVINEPVISTDNSQSNSVSILHLYLTSVLSDIATKPEYDVQKANEGFSCELSIICNQEKMHVNGNGKTKVLAKRDAAFEMLKLFFPNSTTIEQFLEDVNAAAEAKKNDKKGSKSKLSSQQNQQKDDTTNNTNNKKIGSNNSSSTISSSSTTTTTSISSELNVLDELSDTVREVVKDITKYNIIIPNNYSIRLANENDADIILNLILELATYEKSPESVTLTRDELLRDGWGINRKYPLTNFRPDFYVYLVDYTPNQHNNNDNDKVTVGMALFYQVYSTWKGRSIHLEDLYVQEIHRAQGLGTILMRTIGAVVLEMNMKRYQWQCLTWNTKPRQFYNSLGASELSDWMSIRMESNEIENFVQNGRPKLLNKIDDHNINIEDNSNNKSGTSWSDAFRHAKEIGSLCDKDLEDFNHNNDKYDNNDDNDNEEEDNNDGIIGKNNIDSGGFCQPTELASFVASELKISNSNNEPSPISRAKRSHNSSELGQENNNLLTDSKRCKSEF